MPRHKSSPVLSLVRTARKFLPGFTGRLAAASRRVLLPLYYAALLAVNMLRVTNKSDQAGDQHHVADKLNIPTMGHFYKIEVNMVHGDRHMSRRA